ncbi:MAG TPA: hypothetical protein VFY70_06520, partial [Thermomicrobiales bacterium]|nr:hypothetical protein [Thermomicrobiales bacterium]
LACTYGYAASRCSEHEEAPEIVADATGWSWSARIAPNRYQWTRLSWRDDDPRRDQPPAELVDLPRDGRSRGADVTWHLVARPGGPDYLCIGDAAAVLDPASSHGVLKGLMSGMMAGHVLIQALAGLATEEAAIGAFTEWIGELFAAEVTALAHLYRQLPQPPGWVHQLAGDGSRPD